MDESIQITRNDALIIVDMQNDFTIGSLAVPNNDVIFPNINKLIKLFSDMKTIIILTADWHPSNHMSFKALPKHCVEESKGASIDNRIVEMLPNKNIYHERLNFTMGTYLVYKGRNSYNDSYGAFRYPKDYLTKRKIGDYISTTGAKYYYPKSFDNMTPTTMHGKMLETILKRKNRLFVCGLALDYCVLDTAITGKAAGYDVYIVIDATKPVDSKFDINKSDAIEYDIKTIKTRNLLLK
jgi:nicotinamidase/pyrazinamidase